MLADVFEVFTTSDVAADGPAWHCWMAVQGSHALMGAVAATRLRRWAAWLFAAWAAKELAFDTAFGAAGWQVALDSAADLAAGYLGVRAFRGRTAIETKPALGYHNTVTGDCRDETPPPALAGQADGTGEDRTFSLIGNRR